MTDRIKLAESMGWKSTGTPDGDVLWAMPDSAGNYPDGYCFETCELPDPFTDADDDYAVLEWMRKRKGRDHWIHFKNALAELGGAYSCNYKVGMYARAALKVIDNE